MLDVDRNVPGEPLAQIGMQPRVDHRPHLRRPRDHETIEGPAAVQREQKVADVFGVVLHFLLDPALEAGLGPAALRVPAMDGVLDVSHLGQGDIVPSEDPPVLPAHQRHPPGRAGQRLDQRLDRGSLSKGCRDGEVGWMPQPECSQLAGALAKESHGAHGVVCHHGVLEVIANTIEAGVQRLRTRPLAGFPSEPVFGLAQP